MAIPRREKNAEAKELEAAAKCLAQQIDFLSSSCCLLLQYCWCLCCSCICCIETDSSTYKTSVSKSFSWVFLVLRFGWHLIWKPTQINNPVNFCGFLGILTSKFREIYRSAWFLGTRFSLFHIINEQINSKTSHTTLPDSLWPNRRLTIWLQIYLIELIIWNNCSKASQPTPSPDLPLPPK